MSLNFEIYHYKDCLVLRQIKHCELGGISYLAEWKNSNSIFCIEARLKSIYLHNTIEISYIKDYISTDPIDFQRE